MIAFLRKNAGLKLAILIFFIRFNANAQDTAKFPLIPYPAKLTAGQGTFVITARTTIAGSAFKNEAKELATLLEKGLGQKLASAKSQSASAISIIKSTNITASEGYCLSIKPNHIEILANSGAGVFHAIETIRQLLPVSIEKGLTGKKLVLPALTIEDEPAYEWRGMHLDVSRHFFSISYLKRFIDRMALYKMNKLHLHLTDDQGWRIEIKKYPKLTEEGAWRTFNNQDSLCMKLSKDNPDARADDCGAH